MLNNIPIIEDTINLSFVKKNFPEDYKNIDKLKILSKYWLELQTKKNLQFEGDFMFVKTHHALVKMYENPFTIKENTRGVIYIIRDPRDVAISISNHFNFSINKSINNLTDTNFFLRWNDTQNLFFKKKRPLSYISSWENHYESWNNLSFDCPKLIIKFEDMVYNKEKVIKKLINFFITNYGFKFSNLENKILNIINSTNFDNLKEKENEFGFAESVNDNFFNVGKKNQWLEKLSEKEIYSIEKNFSNILEKNRYEKKYYNNL